MVKTALTQRRADRDTGVPWTEDAGRMFCVNSQGSIDTVVTGLAWRREVCQQVFEEAAVDLVKGLKAWSDSRCGKRRQAGRVPSL
jgi:putative transposase